MPLYEYVCTKCRKRFERIEKFSGPHLKKCPDCGGRTERLVSPPAIQFKGSGWYVTDYARAGSAAKPDGAGAGETPAPPAESKPEAAGAAKPAKGKKAKEK